MCLAVPFKIKKIMGSLALAELDGIDREISISLTPGVGEGDWVLVHAGYAIHRLEEREALINLSLLEEFDAKGRP